MVSIWLTPNAREPTRMAKTAVPDQSKFTSFLPLELGNIIKLRPITRAAMGMFMMKSHCQPKLSSNAPNNGPKIPDKPHTEPMIPRAPPLFQGEMYHL